MLRRLIARGGIAAVLLASAALGSSAPAWADGGGCGEFGCTGGGGLAGQTLSAFGSISLSSTSKLDPGKGTLTISDPISIPPCWYQPAMTPQQAVQWVKNLSEVVRANPDMYDEWETEIAPLVATDYHVRDDGIWYTAWCSNYNAAAAQAWTDDHPWFVWVAASNPAPPPAGTQELDPKTMAVYALDSVLLPPTTFTRNPSAPGPATVFVSTWLWLDRKTFGTVSVTATAGPVKVVATAKPSELQLPSIQDATDTPASGVCTSLFDAYAGNANANPACAITFDQSSANQPSLAYQVTVKLVWQASYTSNAGAGGALPSGTVSGTVPVPVQEQQTTVTGGN